MNNNIFQDSKKKTIGKWTYFLNHSRSLHVSRLINHIRVIIYPGSAPSPHPLHGMVSHPPLLRPTWAPPPVLLCPWPQEEAAAPVASLTYCHCIYRNAAAQPHSSIMTQLSPLHSLPNTRTLPHAAPVCSTACFFFVYLSTQYSTVQHANTVSDTRRMRSTTRRILLTSA